MIGIRKKRFGYKKNIFIENHQNFLKITKGFTSNKGQVRITIGMPYVNFFKLNDNVGPVDKQGFFGLTSGIDYFYNNKRYISLNVGAATDYMLPIPVGVDYTGPHESSSSIFLNFRNNHCVGRYDIGYGINISNLSWRKTSRDSAFVGQIKNSFGAGLSLSSAYNFSNNFQVGLLYQPNFINFNYQPAISYKHQFSLQFLFKIDIRKEKKYNF